MRVADAVMAPLAPLPPRVGVAIVSLVTALVILLAGPRGRRISARLAAVKRQIHADLFEMRLFNDDLRALLRAQGGCCAHNGRYLRLSLVPLVCTALPLALVIAQLQAWYGYTGLAAGTEVLVSADLAAGVEPQGSDLRGPGVTVNGPSLYFPSLRQLVWRVVPTAAGPQVLQLGGQRRRVEKTLVVGDGVARRSPLRPGPSLTDQFLEPSEAPLDAGGPAPGDPRALSRAVPACVRHRDALARVVSRRLVRVRAGAEKAARGGASRGWGLGAGG